MLMPGGAREWKRVRRPSLRGMSSLKRTSSINMLLMRTTRSLTSQVSYCSGMVFTPRFAGRARLGEDPWLEDEVAEEPFTKVVELVTFDSAQDVEAPFRLTDI